MRVAQPVDLGACEGVRGADKLPSGYPLAPLSNKEAMSLVAVKGIFVGNPNVQYLRHPAFPQWRLLLPALRPGTSITQGIYLGDT